MLGCAGSAATGGDCSSAAVGAAGSVLINKIMGGDPNTMTAQEKQDRENLVNSILTGTVAALGGDAAAANTAAKIEMENNFLSPQKNDERWQAYKAWDTGNTSVDLAKKIVELDRADQQSEQLLDMYQNGTITDEGLKQLATYLEAYFIDLQGEFGTQEALYRVNSLLENTRENTLTSGESYAKFGDAHRQRQQAEKEAYSSGLLDWFFYSPQKSSNEIRYDKALGLLLINANNEKWAEVSKPALIFLPGGVGNIFRLGEMAGGSYQVGEGIGGVIDGNTLAGASDIGLGGLRVFGSIYTQRLMGSSGKVSPGSSISGEASYAPDIVLNGGKITSTDLSQVGNAGKGTANPGTLTPIFKDKETGINSINPTASVEKGDVNRLAYDPATKKTVMHEGIAAAQTENTLGGKLVRVENTSGRNPDFIFESGPYKGKTVDFMWTNGEKAVQINKNFIGNAKQNYKQLVEHIKKADIVPIDYRVLNLENQKIVNEWLKGMTQEQRSKVLILR